METDMMAELRAFNQGYQAGMRDTIELLKNHTTDEGILRLLDRVPILIKMQ